MAIPIPRAGILEEVRGQDRAWAVSGIAGLELTIGRRRSQELDRETKGREPDTER
jgi:hypothetical protein